MMNFDAFQEDCSLKHLFLLFKSNCKALHLTYFRFRIVKFMIVFQMFSIMIMFTLSSFIMKIMSIGIHSI